MSDQHVTIDQQITCIRRELALRKRVYPKWVDAGKMHLAEANKELAYMQAVHDTLTGLKASQEAQVVPGKQIAEE